MKWEYFTQVIDGVASTRDDDQLDMRGDDGWELVTVTNNGVAYFKRPKAADKDAAVKED
jgi:hypothetical protein